MSAKHTPGTWTVSNEESPLDFQMEVRVMAGAVQICYFIESDKETIANANLIAAAPDLLEALKAVLDELVGPDLSGYDVGSPVDKARSAIAKATGEAT